MGVIFYQSFLHTHVILQVLDPDSLRFREFRDKLFRFALATKLSSNHQDDHHYHADKEGQRQVSLIDLVRLFDVFNELLPDSGSSRDKESLKQAMVMNLLRQVANELTGRQAGYWTLNHDVQLDELTKEITPEDVSKI